MPFKGENIWIIGASSGIGRALAIALAEKGAQLILSARREDELKKLQASLGEGHKIYPLDVSDPNSVKEAAANLKEPVDRVLFMPALYKPDAIAHMDMDFASKMVDVNIKGALYITKAVLEIFDKQKFGQIVLCGSVAGYVGLPNGQPYSATKAAIINFAESLYAEVPEYIDVKLINPGFVSTPMTEKNDFDMPMIITPEKAAEAIMKGLNKKAFEIHFPKRFTWVLKLLAILPYKIELFLTRKMKYKK